MINTNALILQRKDLFQKSFTKSFLELNYVDFKIPMESFYKNSVILFVDGNGQTRILKNRFGNFGAQ